MKGYTKLWKVHADGRVTPCWPGRRRNQIQYDAGTVAAQCIGLGNADYKLSAMYVEFENVASPGDPVTAPAFGKGAGVDYYDDLQVSSDRDFLRVPLLTSPTVGVAAGFEAQFPDESLGNKLTVIAQTQGTEGVHGKAFGDSVNSTVFGVALVATPVWADRTRDVVFARAYYTIAQQRLKEASAQIQVTWEIELPFEDS